MGRTLSLRHLQEGATQEVALDWPPRHQVDSSLIFDSRSYFLQFPWQTALLLREVSGPAEAKSGRDDEPTFMHSKFLGAAR